MPYTDALPCARSDACAVARELAGCRAAASSRGPFQNTNPAYTDALPCACLDACAMTRELAGCRAAASSSGAS